ncbi:hypothetical protein [Nocardia puris]|uniref:Uncharacterized protein n=1 Tax=Nocardia puris TaxID=208602 RepID=A0A366D7F4_9NOCA|nr:hypothetical protein [Nocardia puris]RBO85218.1 hypothetical protein DFR74_11566 [Nocardia puris]
MRVDVPAPVPTGTATSDLVTVLHTVQQKAVAVVGVAIPPAPIDVAGVRIRFGCDVALDDRGYDEMLARADAAVSRLWPRTRIVAGHRLLPVLDQAMLLRSDPGHDDMLRMVRDRWVNRPSMLQPKMVDTAHDRAQAPVTGVSLAGVCGQAGLHTRWIGPDENSGDVARTALTGALAIALLAVPDVFRWSPWLDLDAIVASVLDVRGVDGS